MIRVIGKYAAFVQEGIRLGFGTPWEDLLARIVLGDRNFVEKLKRIKQVRIKGNVKDQPSYRMIRSVEAEAVLKQASDCLVSRICRVCLPWSQV